jgi:hypothetical protein
MAKLILKEFRCVEETDEIGSDSPYFLVFVGDAKSGGAQSDVKLVRKDSWDNEVDSGELRTPNITVTDGFDLDLVLVALIEEDWDPDFAGVTLAMVKAWMASAFNSLASNVSTGIDNTIANLVRDEFVKVLKQRVSNDEILGVKRLPVEPQSGGLLPLLKFSGDGGSYNVRFALA